MLTHLLYFQFGFMYLPALVIGLVVYGSDFDGVTGWLYVVPLVMMIVAHKPVWSRRFALCGGSPTKLLSGMGAAAGLFAYAPLHLSYWDEHSLSQAMWMALLGLCSYLLSVGAAGGTRFQPTPCPSCAVSALALIGALWLMAAYYPMIIIFFLAVLFIVAAFGLRPLQPAQTIKDGNMQGDIIARYTLLLLAADIASVVWDYQVNTSWALYVGIGLLAAAFGYYINSVRRSDQIDQAIYIAALVNFTLAAVWPAYLLWIGHAVVAGLCLGYILPQAITTGSERNIREFSMGWIPWFFMGLVLSNAWYANLQWAITRLVLITPFAVLALLYLRYQGLGKHHS